MTNYTVIIKDDFDSTEQFGTNDADAAEKYANELADDVDDNVFITFNNRGYLNRDGHAPVGKAW